MSTSKELAREVAWNLTHCLYLKVDETIVRDLTLRIENSLARHGAQQRLEEGEANTRLRPKWAASRAHRHTGA